MQSVWSARGVYEPLMSRRGAAPAPILLPVFRPLFVIRHPSTRKTVFERSTMADPVMVPDEIVPPPQMAEPEMVSRGWFHRARPAMIHIDDVPEYRVRRAGALAASGRGNFAERGLSRYLA